MVRRPHNIVWLLAFVLVVVTFVSFTYPIVSRATPGALSTMSVTHTVLFQFKEDAKVEDIQATCKRFLALKAECIHPTSRAPYILSLKGGKDNSPEGLQSGITHGFVVEFASAADRDYYVNTDPNHQAFAESVGNLVDKAIVVDFTDGVY